LNNKWTDREERVYNELVDRLRFWGYQVPSGEKSLDPALLLMLKAFAHHAVQTEDRLKQASETVIDTMIADFFMTGLKRPIPAFTMLSCCCSDKRTVIDTEMEFLCRLSGARERDYSFYPLYDQEVYDVNADVVFFVSGEYFRVLKALPPEADKWEETLQSPHYRTMQRSAPPPLGGTLYIGITAGLPLDEVSALQLYTGPDAPTGKMLNWVDWQVVTSKKQHPTFKPGNYHHKLEIFKHLDIRELELDSSFQSRLYSSDFLTSGKLLWHFKHYLSPAKGFANIPAEMYTATEKFVLPPQIESKFPQIDFGGIKTPRLWLRVDLARDERVGDLRNFRFFDTNTFPVINRRKNHRNKYTMGQPALEVSLFEYADADSANLPEKLFSIDRVWDANDNEYSSHLDLMAFANPRKYMVVEEENDLKIKFNFVPTGKEAPDFVVVGYSMTEGSDGNGIGAEVDFQLVKPHPQIKAVRNLVTSSGGSDARSLQEIKHLTGFFLRNHGVALSEGEIEYLARNFDGRIEEAKAVRGVSRSAGGLVPSVLVEVRLKSDLKISDEERQYLLQRLSDYLDSYTPLNLHLEARLAGS
jgi:hypothetical protein